VAGKLKVTQVKSTISHIARNRATVRALGLRGIGSTSIVADNPATRGMVRQVRFLVSVEEVAGNGTASAGKAKRDKEDGAQASARRGGDEHASERKATGRSEDRGDAPASHRPDDGDTEEASRISAGSEDDE
jgi:large subunit ribosomal protein L30